MKTLIVVALILLGTVTAQADCLTDPLAWTHKTIEAMDTKNLVNVYLYGSRGGYVSSDCTNFAPSEANKASYELYAGIDFAGASAAARALGDPYNDAKDLSDLANLYLHLYLNSNFATDDGTNMARQSLALIHSQ